MLTVLPVDHRVSLLHVLFDDKLHHDALVVLTLDLLVVNLRLLFHELSESDVSVDQLLQV